MKTLNTELLILGGGILGSSLAHFLRNKKPILISSSQHPVCSSLATISARNSHRKKNHLAFYLFEKFYQEFQPEGIFKIDFQNFQKKFLYSGYIADSEKYLEWLKKDILTIDDEMIKFEKNRAFLKNHEISFQTLFLCPGQYNRFYKFYPEEGSILRGYYAEKKIENSKIECYEEKDQKMYYLKNKRLRGVVSDEIDSHEVENFLEEGETLKVGFRYKEKNGFLIKELDSSIYYINGASKNGYLYSQWMVEEVKKCLKEKQKLF